LSSKIIKIRYLYGVLIWWFELYLENQPKNLEIMRLKEINSKIIELSSGLPATNFKPSSKGTLFPIAPSVTAYCTKDNAGNTTIFFRIVVFIDSDNSKPPVFSIDETTNKDFYIEFDLTAKAPANYTVWYIETSYPINALGDVTVYLQNKDPRTSRGTVTTVIVIIPDGVSSNC
jgi:hypothetical protein